MHVISICLVKEFVEGSSVQQNDPSAIIISNDLANPPGEPAPFLKLFQTVKATYTFVDPTTGKREQESKSFVVRGIIKQTGNPNIDNSAVIDTEVGNALFHKSGKFDSLIVVARSGIYVDAIEQEIRKLYGNDIGITTVKAIIKTVQEFTGGISAFLLSIAIVSLVVGAVGIITTLYTSVIERTREIGTMKAIGAKGRHILALFLTEALMIGIFGATCGILGVIIGARLGIADHIDENNNVFDFTIDESDRESIDEISKNANNLYEIIGDCGEEYR